MICVCMIFLMLLYMILYAQLGQHWKHFFRMTILRGPNADGKSRWQWQGQMAGAIGFTELEIQMGGVPARHGDTQVRWMVSQYGEKHQ